MKKSIFILLVMCLTSFMLSSCSKDNRSDGTGKESHFLKCPDNHHPHAIDLGLPSGTKWCCCNVGATTPEDYGGYYAWGETSEKSYYSWDTYAYGNSRSNCYSIGTDISGTEYDVAHAHMGDPWRMPNYNQYKELYSSCTITRALQNGVYGILVTGPSGGQIFLPSAGYYGKSGINYLGHRGLYWLSSLGVYEYSAYAFLFSSEGEWRSDEDYRYIGRTVRAVCP